MYTYTPNRNRRRETAFLGIKILFLIVSLCGLLFLINKIYPLTCETSRYMNIWLMAILVWYCILLLVTLVVVIFTHFKEISGVSIFAFAMVLIYYGLTILGIFIVLPTKTGDKYIYCDSMLYKISYSLEVGSLAACGLMILLVLVGLLLKVCGKKQESILTARMPQPRYNNNSWEENPGRFY